MHALNIEYCALYKQNLLTYYYFYILSLNTDLYFLFYQHYCWWRRHQIRILCQLHMFIYQWFSWNCDLQWHPNDFQRLYSDVFALHPYISVHVTSYDNIRKIQVWHDYKMLVYKIIEASTISSAEGWQLDNTDRLYQVSRKTLFV